MNKSLLYSADCIFTFLPMSNINVHSNRSNCVSDTLAKKYLFTAIITKSLVAINTKWQELLKSSILALKNWSFLLSCTLNFKCL